MAIGTLQVVGDFYLAIAAQFGRDVIHRTGTLNHALDVWLGADPARPAFRRWHFPDKKLFGDNPDAIYYETPVSAEHGYRIRGNIDGATYT
jgi:hypothetical protein